MKPTIASLAQQPITITLSYEEWGHVAAAIHVSLLVLKGDQRKKAELVAARIMAQIDRHVELLKQSLE